MAEQGLKVNIGADISDFQKALKEAVKSIENFDAKMRAAIKSTDNSFKSIDQLNTRLDRLKDAQNKATDAKAFAGLQRAIDVTRARIDILKNGFDGAANSVNRLGSRATGAAPALFSLGQVARDLPFGFIAIQNNLPIVVDQFSALTKASGGVGAALKGIGAALIGPAGIAFAFGAVTAGITALVQKYGSLGGAIDALFKSNDRLFQLQKDIKDVTKEANEAVGEQISRFNFLAQSAANSNLALDARRDAIKKLRDEYGAYLQNLTDEDILNGKLVTSTNLVVSALRAKAVAQAAVAKAGQLTSENLDDLEKEEKLTAQIVRREGELLRVRNSRSVIGQGVNAGANDPLQETQRVINALKLERDELRKTIRLREERIDALFGRAQRSNAIAGEGAIDSSNRRQLDALKEQEKAIKAAEAAEKKRLAEITKSAREAQRLKVLIPIEIQTVPVDKARTALEAALEQARKETIANTKFEVPLQITVPQQTFDQLRQFGESENLKLLQDRAAAITTQFNEFLAPAINTVFGALENGQSIPKALVQAFKALAVQIAATIAKAVILSAILEATGLGGVARAAGAVGRGLGAVLNFSGVAAPSFGGISGGGLGLQGQVVFVQRGTDLVGVLNQSNAQIRRVG